MNNTFLEYLTELDRGDLELSQEYNNQLKDIEYDKAASDFRNQMISKSKEKAGVKSKEGEPSKGDIITTNNNNKKYAVIKRDNKGFRIKELGGSDKELLMKHGYKYKKIDKTPLGKVIYKVFK